MARARHWLDISRLISNRLVREAMRNERALHIGYADEGGAVTERDIWPVQLAFYEGKIAKWWTPDDVVFTDAIPLGATGKMQKNKLREQFKAHKLPTA